MSDNTEKQKSGQDFKALLAANFTALSDMGVIKGFKASQDFPHIGFSYEKQYKANFILETLDEKFIIICSSTSYKSDRHNQYNWNIQGILENSEISDRVVASVILYSNKEKDNGSFQYLRNAIANREAYSPASHLLTVDELLEFLENYSAEIQSQIADDEEEPSHEDVLKEQGSAYGQKGFLHEKQLANALESDDFLDVFKGGTLSDAEPYHIILNAICKFNGLNPADIIEIEATDTVPLLQSGGNAKADVIITISTQHGTLIETVSIKTSTKNRVSCHDYSAESFIRVLQCENTKLADYLMKFQANPTYSSFEKALSGDESVEHFCSLIAPQAQRLTEWALSGAHDVQNLKDPEKQVSRYIFAQLSDHAFCYELGFYIQKLFETTKLKYEVPLSWTYPSKQGGKRIQLKVPLKKFD